MASTSFDHMYVKICTNINYSVPNMLYWLNQDTAYVTRSVGVVSNIFAQPFVQAQIKENIKAPYHWPLWGEYTGDRCIPSQRASNVEYVSIWWRHHAIIFENIFFAFATSKSFSWLTWRATRRTIGLRTMPQIRGSLHNQHTTKTHKFLIKI